MPLGLNNGMVKWTTNLSTTLPLQTPSENQQVECEEVGQSSSETARSKLFQKENLMNSVSENPGIHIQAEAQEN